MDEKTLLDHKKQWVTEHKQTTANLLFLSSKELTLYNKLRDNQLGENVRLEQEFVQYLSLEKALE